MGGSWRVGLWSATSSFPVQSYFFQRVLSSFIGPNFYG